MEQGKCKEITQQQLDSECQDVQYKKPSSLPSISSQIDGREAPSPKIAAPTPKIAAPTPEKSNESIRNSHKDEAAELPENYKAIVEFFNHMTCSLRLLALRKKLPIFETISRQVEILSGRKFSCKHLSQIKHILPEAVHTDKILIHDKKTLCMKPDIKITFTFDVVKGHQEQSPFIALQQLLTSRLLDLATKLPTIHEIPEAEMPEPFNKKINSINIDALPEDISTESQNSASQTELLSNSTHINPSLNNRFSSKMAEESKNKTPLLASQILTTKKEKDIKSVSIFPHDSNPVQLAHPSSSLSCETTPLKVEFESSDLVLLTPAQLTPQRSVPSCDNKPKNMKNEIVTPYSAKRSLDFSIMEGEENASDSTSNDMDSSKFLDHTFHQNIAKRGLLEEDDLSNVAVLPGKVEKGRCSSKNLSTNQTLHAGLSDLIALIHQSFQSVSSSAITKDELIYKIMINNCEIVERREVEEQIRLLETLVPDWICSKLVPSGDMLYNIKKQSDPTSVCSMLYEQVRKLSEVSIIEP